MTDTQLLDDLRAVRHKLTDDGGWTQGTYYQPATGCYCLAGAVHAAVDTDDGFAFTGRKVRVFNALTMQIRGEGVVNERFIPEAHVVNWNDNEIRTESEVLDLLDETIERVSKS